MLPLGHEKRENTLNIGSNSVNMLIMQGREREKERERERLEDRERKRETFGQNETYSRLNDLENN